MDSSLQYLIGRCVSVNPAIVTRLINPDCRLESKTRAAFYDEVGDCLSLFRDSSAAHGKCSRENYPLSTLQREKDEKKYPIPVLPPGAKEYVFCNGMSGSAMIQLHKPDIDRLSQRLHLVPSEEHAS